MKYLPMIFVLGTLFSMAIIGCQQPVGPVLTHKLVVTGNQHAVPMYPDEQTYLHTSHEKQEGGVVGVVGDVKQNNWPRSSSTTRLPFRLLPAMTTAPS